MFDENMLNQLYATKITFASITGYIKNTSYDIVRAPSHYGIIFGVTGKMQFNHNGHTYICDRNHAVFIPADSQYTYCALEENTNLALINFKCVESFKVEDFHVFHIENPESLLSNHAVIQKLYVSNSPASFPELMMNFYSLLSRLVKAACLMQEQGSTWRITEYIENNISNPNLTIADISEAAGFSEVHFRKLFKSYYNISPKQYMQNLRLDRAKKLLESTNDPISKNASNCGFSTIFYFSKLFKDKVGCSPYEYRKRHRKSWF